MCERASKQSPDLKNYTPPLVLKFLDPPLVPVFLETKSFSLQRQYFFVGSNIFDLVTLTLELKILNLVCNFSTVCARVFIFYMNISCDKIFMLIPNCLPYYILAFLVTISFYWYQYICPCDLGHLWNWLLSRAFVFHKHSFLSPASL